MLNRAKILTTNQNHIKKIIFAKNVALAALNIENIQRD